MMNLNQENSKQKQKLKQKKQTTPLEKDICFMDLPNDVQQRIFSKLPVVDLGRIMAVHSEWRHNVLQAVRLCMNGKTVDHVGSPSVFADGKRETLGRLYTALRNLLPAYFQRFVPDLEQLEQVIQDLLAQDEYPECSFEAMSATFPVGSPEYHIQYWITRDDDCDQVNSILNVSIKDEGAPEDMSFRLGTLKDALFFVEDTAFVDECSDRLKESFFGGPGLTSAAAEDFIARVKDCQLDVFFMVSNMYVISRCGSQTAVKKWDWAYLYLLQVLTTQMLGYFDHKKMVCMNLSMADIRHAEDHIETILDTFVAGMEAKRHSWYLVTALYKIYDGFL